jgi:hypothetical protein
MKRLIYQGMLIGILVTIVADSIHWMVTASQAASSGRRLLVIAQIIVIGGLALWLWRRARKDAALLEIMLPGNLSR